MRALNEICVHTMAANPGSKAIIEIIVSHRRLFTGGLPALQAIYRCLDICRKGTAQMRKTAVQPRSVIGVNRIARLPIDKVPTVKAFAWGERKNPITMPRLKKKTRSINLPNESNGSLNGSALSAKAAFWIWMPTVTTIGASPKKTKAPKPKMIMIKNKIKPKISVKRTNRKLELSNAIWS